MVLYGLHDTVEWMGKMSGELRNLNVFLTFDESEHVWIANVDRLGASIEGGRVIDPQ